MRELIHRWFLLFCVVLLAFKGSKCLFMRHSQAGRCVVRGKLIASRDWGAVNYAELDDRCLDDDAQFYYTDTKLLRNREQNWTFLTRDDTVVYRKDFILYYGKSWAAIRDVSHNTNYSLEQTINGSLFLDKKGYCATRVSDKYLERTKSCVDSPDQKFTFGSVTQFNSKMKDVHCSPAQRMAIKKADYGDFNNSGTFDYNTQMDTKCSSLANCEVKTRCGGKRSCELTFDSNLLPSQYCPDTSKEIYTEYTCVDTINATKITSAPNIRLSDSGSEGFIEIKDGSIWRKVDELMWDKDLQKMLCQQLGFSEADKNDIVRKEVASGQEIASGHLVYNNTQPSGSPCCVYLEPSTTSSIVNLPYVTCKICDKPTLLQDRAKFPDSVFSGSGGSNSYKEARFSNDGVCPTGSGAKYLWIDLQKEYHITRIVTLSDRSQTKWSGSYSLKYSHDQTLVDRSSTVQITGNQYGYQASSTAVNIYNVRYLKIQSGSTDFCLRIELCGQVQSPAPVTKLVATPSYFSVHLFWITPGSWSSSYITDFIIYLDDTKVKTITRDNQLTIDGLKPNTTYSVAIISQDGNSGKSRKTSATFTTKQPVVPNGPPLNVAFISRGKNSLEVSWKAPEERFRRGVIIGYQVCHSTDSTTPVCQISTTLSFTIENLQSFTKYFVTVAAATKFGYGNKSLAVSKFTNGDRVNPVVTSHYSLGLYIKNPAKYVKEVMVIVQKATSISTPSEDIKTSELKPYQANKSDPYVTAYLKTDDLPLNFVIGDGKEYNSDEEKYVNLHLEQNSSYIVFLRFFESEVSSYSTEWSSSVVTITNPQEIVIVGSQQSKSSSNDDTRMDIIIPLVVLLLCFILLLGVVVYLHVKQRRELQELRKQQRYKGDKTKIPECATRRTEKFDSIQEPVSTYESTEGANAALGNPYVNEERVYETTEDILTPENTKSKPDQEPCTYTSLTDEQGPLNFYQPLQPPGSSTATDKRNGGDERDKNKVERTMVYENLAFNAQYSDE